ncbi:chitin deacetylase [Globomyces sp. JEL0801]|nr:chitin deacetylase [Globomyces sp. JEL0801]
MTIGSAFSIFGSTVPINRYPPPIPQIWPSLDEKVMISGNLLQDPLVQEAWEYVRSVVDPALLAIPPSSYIQLASVSYHSDPAKTCYWSFNHCVRYTDTKDFKADIVNCPNRNDWGLTYDDGPSQNAGGSDTAGIQSALKALNWKATFFIIGSNLMLNKNDMLIRAHQEGHQIGLHTWSHHPMTSLTNEQIVAEMNGDIDDRVRAIVAALGYRTVLWSRDSGDTGISSSALTNILSWNQPDQPGFISLQHDLTVATSRVAIQALSQFQAIPPTALKPQPVGSCLGDSNWYGGDGKNLVVTSAPTTTATTTTVVPTATFIVSLIAQPTLLPADTTKASAANQSGSSCVLIPILIGLVQHLLFQ